MNRKVAQQDLYLQYRSIKDVVDKSIGEVVESQMFIGGHFVEEFERKFAKYCNVKWAISVNSGTDALYLSLLSLGIGKGDEVITTPFTFIATAEAIALTGARPVFVDIDPGTFNIDASLITKKITRKTKAIIPVHLFGQPSKMDGIMSIARKHRLFVVEDVCQAVGARFQKKRVGGIGHLGCFSFFPAKNLGAFGDGGMVTTNSNKLAEKLRLLRNHGSKVKYHHEIIGVNSRLDALQANILSAKLKYLSGWNQERRNIAKEYSLLLSDISNVAIPFTEKDTEPVFNQYTIRIKSKSRDDLKKYLDNQGVSTAIYYPVPLHLLEAMRYLGYRKGDFPISENSCKEVLSLPIYPGIGKKNVIYVAGKIKEYMEKSQDAR